MTPRSAHALWNTLTVVAMAAVGFVFVASGLIAPFWVVPVLCTVWVVALVRLWRLRPTRRPLVPVALAVGWFAVMTFGDMVLYWTA
jgi:hypothetical protein